MTEYEGAALRVAVFGSCVSRDTVAAAPAGPIELLAYVARHSLCSAGTDATRWMPSPVPLTSAFQLRNFVADADGTAFEPWWAAAERADVLLVDLTDERHGVVEFADGTRITRSIEGLVNAEIAAAYGAGEHLRFGSDEHFARWSAAADAFLDRLGERGLLARTLLVAVPWAERAIDGAAAPGSMGTAPRDANAAYARYHELVRARGVALVSVDDPRADPGHRWGFAPFHYAPEVYAAVHEAAVEVARAAGRRRG